MNVLLGCVGPSGGFNIGLLYLASYARKHGEQKHVFKISNNILSDLTVFYADVVGLYCSTVNADLLTPLVLEIKAYNPAIRIVVGGHHASVLAMDRLHPYVDFVVVGEGELAFADILDGKLPRGKIKYGVVRDLDVLPPPARDLVKMDKSDWIYMVTSRGCPYKCVYCASASFWGQPRYHSSNYVVSELKGLVMAGYKRVCFGDDLFIGDFNRLENIASLIRYYGLKVELACTVRANLVNQRLCGLLKQLNVTRVSFGVESGCEKTLAYLKCGSVTVAQNRDAVRLLKKNGFIVNGSFIVGSPKETFAQAQETLEFIKNEPFDGVDLFTFTPYPGTEAYSNVGCHSWGDYDVFRRRMIFAGGMSDVELQAVYKEFDKVKRKKRFAYLVRRGLADPARFKYVLSGRLSKQK